MEASELEDSDAQLWIAPVLTDLQINGFSGIDFQQDDLTLKNLEEATRGLIRNGCGRYFPTLITSEWERMMHRLERMCELRRESELLKRVICGWHLEGPYVSAEPGFRGAHKPDPNRLPRIEELEQVKRITGDFPTILTVAPERDGIMDWIIAARKLGFHISLGHTNADFETIGESMRHGATGFTHLGNGCPTTLRRGDNIILRILETPELMIGLIPDGIHLSGMLFRLLHKMIPNQRIYYTTDAMAAAGAPPGIYPLGDIRLEVGDDRVVRLPGESNLAGSALTPIEGVFKAASLLGTDWQSVWLNFSRVPASWMNINTELKEGSTADFCIITEHKEQGRYLCRTFLNGSEQGEIEGKVKALD